MTDKIAYELGACKLMAATGPDRRGEFSREAPENRKPVLGVGPSEGIGNDEKDRRARNQTGDGSSSERNASPRDTKEAPAPNPDAAPGTANTPLKRGAASGDASRPLPEGDPENDSTSDRLKRPVRGAIGDALKRRVD